ncbi:DUF1648 domain-containing protein [Saccharopolyspora sp. HNM0983]|uniref:DUF1648 domain-containing protein n=1 Tax=Saccharopolyspora montiporae TaxID=2781240 RepID=A0A929BB33_9PSEU|nr:DUF1648 domain-containing protein [Saccharopolyspora sp. HNM0983]MBE9374418.1 DUF1648 domain-containing protein [Saccharopolyspora sp. HNM0983]
MSRFATAGALGAGVVSAATVAPALAVRDRLPDPLATHWGPGGSPDGALGLGAHVAALLVLWLAVVAFALVTELRSGSRARTRPAAAAALSGGAVFVLGLQAVTLLSNVDATRWVDADPVHWQVVPVLALAAAAAGLGWWLVRRRVPAQQDPDGAGSGLRLPPGHRAVWVSAVSSPVLLVVSAALPAAAVPAALFGPWYAPLLLVVAALTCLGLSSARVQVDESGVRIGLGPQRWPVRRLPLHRIRGARAEERHPLEAGGWGYRWMPGFTAVMLRGGPSLVLQLDSGRDFVVSAEEPERGADVVTALLSADGTRAG